MTGLKIVFLKKAKELLVIFKQQNNAQNFLCMNGQTALRMMEILQSKVKWLKLGSQKRFIKMHSLYNVTIDANTCPYAAIVTLYPDKAFFSNGSPISLYSSSYYLK